MSDYSRHVDATFERFSAEIRYTCPKCGAEWLCDLTPDDVYWIQEGGLDVTCDKRGASFLVWGGLR